MPDKTPKVFTNEDGSISLTLPVAKTEVTLRSPKGRDIKAMELASSAEGATNTSTLFVLISHLAIAPKLSIEDIEDLDAEDVFALGEAVASFRALRKR